MKRKITLLFVGLLVGMSLVACNFRPQGTANYEDPVPTGFTIVRLHTKDGDLQSLLADEAQKAESLGRIPVVEFDATWCPPCQAINKAIKENNKLILDAYADTYIIRLDVDEWGWEDSDLHDFQFEGIPVFFKLDSTGNQTGDTINGGAWGEDIPENIAPVMDAFFHDT